MKVVENKKMDSALSKAEQLRKLMREVGKNNLADDLAGLIKAARDQRFVIGVVGSTKRGKSTMINGLLGQHGDDCAPVGKFPATNVVSIFSYSANSSVKVVLVDNTIRNITEREIRLYVTEEHNPGNIKGVRSVEVSGPFSGLEKDVYIVDTPGANNALTSMHGEILLEFLPVADAVIFLVTADEPLTEAEQKLLKEIKGNNTRKIFFAVNKVDRVDSGDLDQEELAQGIEHNRKILSDVGFPDAAIYEVSAKNFFEKQCDPGTERLLASVREMISKDRHDIMFARVNDRMKMVLERCHAELSNDLVESKATIVELEAERKLLERTRNELRRGKSNRERQFTEEWNVAFDELERNVRVIRKELVSEYSNLIENASATKIPALSHTIHSDVQIGFTERLRPKMDICEVRLNEAMANLEKSVQTVMLTISPEISQSGSMKSMVKDSMKIGGAAVPSLVTATVSANLPGIVGGLIASSVPTPAVATFAWLSPSTWIPATMKAISVSTISTGGTAITVALTAIAMPIAIGAFGFAALRAYSTWKEIKNMQRNDMKSKVIEMIDDGCGQIIDQINKYRKVHSKILVEFDRAIEASIEQADNRLGELVAKRPEPGQVQVLECNVNALSRQVKLLASTTTDEDGSRDGTVCSSPLVDDLRAIK